jgi:hypothetical protein
LTERLHSCAHAYFETWCLAKRLVLNMSGPAAVTQAKDWPAFQEEWRATFAEHAKEAGVAFDVQKGEPRPTGKPAPCFKST